MCWINDDRRTLKAGNDGKFVETKMPSQKIAEDDIVVFKVLRKWKDCGKPVYHYTSAVMGYPYTIGKTYCDDIHLYKTPWNEWTIDKGLHCFSKKTTFSYKKNPCSRLGRMCMIVDTGHGIVTYNDDAIGLYRQVVVKCVIPKGSAYYENFRGEIVTDKIIILEEIPSKLVRNKTVIGENLCAGKEKMCR
jgi:hypothetical protein